MKYKNIGEFIVKLRKEKDMSQEELASLLNYSSTNISKWETGRSCPNSDALLELSKFFDVTIEELLLGKRRNESNCKELSNVVITKFKKDKRDKIFISCISLLLSILIIFIVIYFVFIKSSVKIYRVRGFSDEFYFENGMFAITNRRIVMNIPKIESIHDKKIDGICLYYEVDSRKYYMLCSNNNETIHIEEDVITNDYFGENVEDIIGNLHLSIYSEDTITIVDTDMEEIYINDEIFKNKTSDEHYDSKRTNWESKYVDVLLKDGFVKENGVYVKNTQDYSVKYIDEFKTLKFDINSKRFAFSNDYLDFKDGDYAYRYNISDESLTVYDLKVPMMIEKTKDLKKYDWTEELKILKNEPWLINIKLIKEEKKTW